MTRRLIVTADDFGMSTEVNDAVEEAHRRGILTCASLVVTGAAAADAVVRARRMPRLGVGLHLALVAAPPVLAPAEIPALIGSDGLHLTHEPSRVGFRIAVSRFVRSQARAEIVAQLDGVQEGSFVLVGTVLGIDAAGAVALSLILRARDLVLGLPAVLLWSAIEGRRLVNGRRSADVAR